MGKRILAVLVAMIGIATGVPTASAQTIEFDVTPLDGGVWRYDYYVTNPASSSLPGPIGWFSVYFDQSLYLDLANATAPAGWDPLLQVVDPALPADGLYDAFTSTHPVAAGETAGGFSVSFSWLGVGSPGSQLFDIIDTDPASPVGSGFTSPRGSYAVPELSATGSGSALLMLAMVCAILCSSRRPERRVPVPDSARA